MALKIKTYILCSILVVSIQAGCASTDLWDDDQWVNAIHAGEHAQGHQSYAEAERQFKIAIQESGKYNNYNDRSYKPFVEALASQGKYDQAIKAENLASSLSLATHFSDTHPDWHFRSLGDFYMAQGNYSEALKNYKAAVKLGRNVEYRSYQIDEEMARYYIEVAEYEKAKPFAQEMYDLYKNENGPRMDRGGRAAYILGFVEYGMGNYDRAGALLEEARHVPDPFGVFFDIEIKIASLRGKLLEKHGDIAGAEALLQRFLKVVRNPKALGGIPRRVQQADLLNMIAALQLKLTDPEKAKKAYNESIALRLATQGPLHPAYADSLKGMADVTAYEANLTSAAQYATFALDTFDKELVPTHPRIAPALVALASIDMLTSHAEQAAPLEARLETILQKPLGPWKEDLLDTAQLYAGLLKKTGKMEEAIKLEELYARQKGKR